MKPLWWLVSLLLMALLWMQDASSTPLGLTLRHPLDWLLHVAEYLVLGAMLGRATGRRGPALVIAVWFAAVGEVHQAFVAGRDAGIQDWLFDLLGAWIGSRATTRRRVPPVPDQPEVSFGVTGFPDSHSSG